MWISPAYAQTATGPSGGASAFLQFAPLVFIFIIFYFLMIRPQQQKLKQHRAMIDAVKKGDTVVTGGGLIGKAVKVSDIEVEIELAAGVKVRAIKATLTDVRALGSVPAANDTAK